MGDCIMAFWNAPIPCDNHAEMAVKTSIEIELLGDELEEKMKLFATRIRKDQCLDLKPKVRSKRYIELDGEGKKIYEKLRTSALAIVEDSTISFSNKLTEIIKLHQVCNGFTKEDDGKMLRLHDQKVKALHEVIEETDGKIIIWANYLWNIHEIIHSLKSRYGEESVVSIFGEVDVKDRKKAVEKSQTISLDKFIYSIGIRHIGQENAKILAGFFNSIKEFTLSLIHI